MDWPQRIFDFLIDRPIIMMAFMSLPFFAICRWKKCFPSQRLMVVFLLPLLISLGTIGFPWLLPLIWLSYLIITTVVLADLFTIAREKDFVTQRNVIKIASLGKNHDVTLDISNRSNASCRTEIRDDLPNEFQPEIEQFEHEFKPRSRSSFDYRFQANERGRFDIEKIHIKVFSRLGFWHGYYAIDQHDEIFVYPDMKQISEYALLARTNRLNLLGVRRSRKIGQDNEFERLRDYSQDDNYKHIDWRTTARRQKLTVKDFQSNQSQRIIFMVDCGRMMTGGSHGTHLLDYSLNAMLMLSYVALRQGDSVGLICFSDSIHSYTPPKGGVKHINRLLHATFDQQSRFVESRYDQAFYYLRRHCLKRSLVVLITNVIDEINAHQIHQYLGNLTTRHLPVGVLLRDHQMFNAIEDYLEQPSLINTDRFYTAAAAAKITNWRHQVITDLQHQGVLAVDVYPEQLTAKLVNEYLEIKAKHLL
ncbi:MAG: DUF58 domain-containing protein [Planctomycetota bacterium]